MQSNAQWTKPTPNRSHACQNSGKILLEMKHQKLQQHAHALARKLGIKHNSQTQSKSDMHENMAMLYALKSSVK